uniref:DUF4351 domain-containing protein n=1 Tax=Cyanothece sp. (strain PCC 7425 / ATCC 29141) TaxID=395961 RepID=B8HL59_CYAP4
MLWLNPGRSPLLDKLKSLAEALLDFTTLADLQTWLECV